MTADFAAFHQYLSLGFDEDTAVLSLPRHTSNTNGNHIARYLMVNMEEASRPEFRELSANALSHQFQSAAMPQKDIDAVLVSLQTYSSLLLNSQRTRLDPEQILRDAENEGVLSFAGGGAAVPKASLFVTDVRTVNEFHQMMFPHASERERTLGIGFVNHHEASHLILGLSEPGADFMAAALILREHPDARDMLRSWADLRLLEGILNENASERYGSECHDVIEQVLNMPPEELQAMTVEQLYAGAKQFDAANDRNNAVAHSAEDNVRDSLKDWDVSRGLRFLWNKVSHFEVPNLDDVSEHFKAEHVTAQDMADKLDTLSFAENSPEARLATDVRESVARARQNHMPGF